MDLTNFSLLYPDAASQRRHYSGEDRPDITEDVVEQLGLAELLDLKNSELTDFFTSDPAVILYRMDTFTDMLAHAELGKMLNRLIPVLGDVMELRRLEADSGDTESYLLSITEIELYISSIEILHSTLRDLRDQLTSAAFRTLADRIIEYDEALLRQAVKAGADAISFGDDYGTERSLLMSPELWRSFFKPRLKRLFSAAVDQGLDIHFHSCGQVWDILPDLKDIGVTSIWPQLPAYNMEALAKYCRELGLAVEIHTDRANTMTYGTPAQVRELVRREFDTFRMMEGGSWFYIEADNGFPFANLEALVKTIAEYR